MLELVVFITIMICGYISRVILEVVTRRKDLLVLSIRVLVNSLYYFMIPVAFFTTFIYRGVSNRDLYIVSYFLTFMVLTYALLRLVHNSPGQKVLFLTSTFPNSVFLGFPLCYVLFDNINVASLFGVFTVTLNVIVADLLGARRLSCRSVFTSTALLGFLAGITGHYLVSEVTREFLFTMLAWSPRLLGYTATFTMGLRIPVKLTSYSGLRRVLTLISLFRFILAPLLATLYSTLAGFTLEDTLQLIIVSATPPAVMNAIVAEKYKWSPELVALVVTILTVLFLLVVFPALYIVFIILH